MKNLRNILSLLALVVFVILATLYIKANIGVFSQLALVNLSNLWILALLAFTNSYLLGLMTKVLAGSLGIRLSHFEAFALPVITAFYNLIAPFRGGIAGRAVYLKQRHQLSYTDFVGALSAETVLRYLAVGLVGATSMLIIYATTAVINWLVFGGLVALFATLLTLALASPVLSETRFGWLNRFIRVVNSWSSFNKERRVIVQIAVLVLVRIALSATSNVVAFNAFGLELSFVEGVFISSVSQLALLISFTPGGLGVNEAVAVYSASAIGISPLESLPVTLLRRAIWAGLVLVIGPFVSYALMREVLPGREPAAEPPGNNV